MKRRERAVTDGAEDERCSMKTLEEKLSICLRLTSWTSGQLQTTHRLTIEAYDHVKDVKGDGWEENERAFEVWPSHEVQSGKPCKTLEAAVDSCLAWLIARREEQYTEDAKRSAEDAERAVRNLALLDSFKGD